MLAPLSCLRASAARAPGRGLRALGRGAAFASQAALNRRLRSDEFKAFRLLVRENAESFDQINLITCLSRAAKELGRRQASREVATQLLPLCTLKLREVPLRSSRALATLSWALGRLQETWVPSSEPGVSPIAVMHLVVAQTLECDMDTFSPLDLAMLLWGLATTQRAAREEARLSADDVRVVFSRAAVQLAPRLCELEARGLVMLLCAHAALAGGPRQDARNVEASGDLLLKAISEAAQRSAEISTRGIVNVLWAIASIRCCDAPRELRTELTKREAELQPPDIANLLWSFCSMSLPVEAVTETLPSQARWQHAKAGPREWAAFADAFPACREEILPKLSQWAQQMLRTGSCGSSFTEGAQGPLSLGAVATRAFLASAGIRPPEGPFFDAASLRCELKTRRKGAEGLVICFAAYELRVGDEGRSGTVLRRNASRDSASTEDSFLSPVHLPATPQVERGGCAEFRVLTALEAVAQEVMELDGSGRALEGSVDLYVTEPPCLSCMANLQSFANRFPCLQLNVAVDGMFLPFEDRLLPRVSAFAGRRRSCSYRSPNSDAS